MSRFVCAAALALGFVALAGCKQGKGERCQVTADCAGNLICSSSTGTCTGTGTQNEDAEVPQMDGGVDAPRDAPADAPPDSL